MLEAAAGRAAMRIFTYTSEVKAGELRYGRAGRLLISVIAGSFIGLAIFFLSELVNGRSKDSIVDIAAVAMFSILGTACLVEFNFVRHRYDENFIHYGSPWRRSFKVPWTSIEEINWRKNLKLLDFVSSEGQVLHFSPLLGGLRNFAVQALVLLPPKTCQYSIEATFVLELMARNHLLELTVDSRSPAVILASLPVEDGKSVASRYSGQL